MAKRNLVLCFFTVMLFMSCILPLGTLASGKQVVAVAKEMIRKETSKTEKNFVTGRMDIESDYPGSGANNRHDPRGPGRD